MKNLITFIIIFFICGITFAKIPAWVSDLKKHPRLGQVNKNNIFIRNKISYDYARFFGKTYINYQLVFLNGGIGKLADFSHQYLFSKNQDFKSNGIWVITPNKEIISLASDEVLKISNAFLEYILYSDDLKAEWLLNNYPVGCIAALDFQIVVDEPIYSNIIYLQSDDEIDTTIVEYNILSDCALKFQTKNVPSEKISITKTGFYAGHFKEWESKPFDGGYEVTAPQVSIEYFPSGDTNNTPMKWSKIASEYARLFEQRAVDYTMKWEGSITDIISRFERDFRYVAIEIGEGKYIPHSPKDVYKFKYGDCKDLSLLFSKILTGSGFIAYPVLVNFPANEPFNKNFPDPGKFNHCIVGIQDKDSIIYYDPTSRGYDYGNLPWNLQGAPALILKENSDLISLPKDLNPLELKQSFEGNLDPSGIFIGRLTINYDKRLPKTQESGSKREEIIDLIDDFLRKNLLFELMKFSEDTSNYSIQIDLRINNYAEKIGGALYWMPFPFSTIDFDTLDSLSNGYYWGRPVSTYSYINIKLPQSIEPPAEYLDELILDIGKASCCLHYVENSFIGEWSKQFMESYYPLNCKEKLDILQQTIVKHQQKKYKLKFK